MENQNGHLSKTKPTLTGIFDLIKKSWQIYAKNIKNFSILISILILPILFSWLFEFFSKKFFLGTDCIYLSWILQIINFLISLAALVFTIWIQLGLLFLIKEREKFLDIKQILKMSWSKIIPFLWIVFLSNFIAGGGFFLFIVPGIFLAVSFSFSNYFLVSENLKGMEALLASKQLIKGYWWKILWRNMVKGFLTLVIFGLVALVIDILIGKTAGDFLMPIVSFYLMPFLLIYDFLIFQELKQIKVNIISEAPKTSTKVKYILIGLVGLTISLIFGSILYKFLKTIPTPPF